MMMKNCMTTIMRVMYSPIFFYGLVAGMILWNLLLPGYIPQSVSTFGPIHIWEWKELINGGLLLSTLLSFVLPTWVTHKILLIGIIVSTGLSMHYTLPVKQKWPKYLAGFFYIVNPFFYTRLIIGHNYLLVGYALLPIAIWALNRASNKQPIKPIHEGEKNVFKYIWERIDMGLLITFFLIMNISIHTAYIFLVLAAIFLGTRILLRIKQSIQKPENETKAKNWKEGIGIILISLIGATLLNGYQFLPGSGIDKALSNFDWERDFVSYSTASDETYGTIVNVLGLYGYYAENQYFGYDTLWPKFILPYWPIFPVTVLILSIFGAINLIRKKRKTTIMVTLMVALPLATLLAAGLSSELSKPVFIFFYNSIPYFTGFRDSQKWTMVLAFTYAYLGTIGLQCLIKTLRKSTKIMVISAAFTGVTLYTFTLFFAFNQQLKTYWYPPEWEKLKTMIERDTGSEVVSLPWQIYSPYTFTNGHLLGEAPKKYLYPLKVWSSNSTAMDFPLADTQDQTAKNIQDMLSKPTQENIKALTKSSQIKYIWFEDNLLPDDPLDYSFLLNKSHFSLIYQKNKTYLYKIKPPERQTKTLE